MCSACVSASRLQTRVGGAAIQVRVQAHAEEATLIPLITGISVKAAKQ